MHFAVSDKITRKLIFYDIISIDEMHVKKQRERDYYSKNLSIFKFHYIMIDTCFELIKSSEHEKS